MHQLNSNRSYRVTDEPAWRAQVNNKQKQGEREAGREKKGGPLLLFVWVTIAPPDDSADNELNESNGADIKKTDTFIKSAVGATKTVAGNEVESEFQRTAARRSLWSLTRRRGGGGGLMDGCGASVPPHSLRKKNKKKQKRFASPQTCFAVFTRCRCKLVLLCELIFFLSISQQWERHVWMQRPRQLSTSAKWWKIILKIGAHYRNT